MKTIFRHSGRVHVEGLVSPLRRRIRTTPRSSSRSSGATSSRCAPDHATQRALEQLYVSSDYEIRPVVAAILKHPALYDGPRLVKPPVVYNAGLLRRIRRGIDTTAWAWLGSMAGQQLFYPPNVAGWDDTRWLDTATWRGRWWIAQYVLDRYALDPGHAHEPYDATKLLDARLAFWHHPPLGTTTRARAPHVRAPRARRRERRRRGSASSTR